MVKTGGEVTHSICEESILLKDKIKESEAVELVSDSVSKGLNATGEAIITGIDKAGTFIDENETMKLVKKSSKENITAAAGMCGIVCWEEQAEDGVLDSAPYVVVEQETPEQPQDKDKQI